MSEACPEGEGHFIVDGYRMVHELGNSTIGFMQPHGNLRATNLLPNCFVCEEHWGKVPKDALRSSPVSIEGIIYGVSPVAGIDVRRVSKNVGVASFREDSVEAYLSRDVLEICLPCVLAVIDDFKRRNWESIADCCKH